MVRASPDGYTLLLPPARTSTQRSTTSSASILFATSHQLLASAAIPAVMTVNLSLSQDCSEFIAYEGQSRKVNMASGCRSPSHVFGELFKMMTGVNMVHVPYRGSPAAFAEFDRGTGASDFSRQQHRRLDTFGRARYVRWQ